MARLLMRDYRRRFGALSRVADDDIADIGVLFSD